ncbi:AAA domain protein [Mesorhizobium plurifarium]|uniref:AAA domain protein n=1 Tax=Mesorhizobium plurifarium TaxID=69974 RepID=A0A0K2W4P9_MESPL|nr:AAA domain protein [Mesorhizobium plurifarium]
MIFSGLTLNGWRQFEEIDISFHPKLTVITGANGAGKSTLLSLISQHYDWSQPLLSTPTYSKDGLIRYVSGLFPWVNKSDNSSSKTVGKFFYSNGAKSEIVVPSVNSIMYNVTINPQPPVLGLHIGSHRPAPTYQQVGNIPTNAIGAAQAYNTYHSEIVQRQQNSYSQFGPIYRMKEAIISMATFGPGNRYVQRNENVAKLLESFKEVLSKTLPPSIGFRDISVRIPDVIIVTDTGDFVIDAASGGLMSLIDLSWQIFLYAYDKNQFVITIDEPENHLHPSMQRALLNRLILAFPNAQFIVATHSPFIVSSVKDSAVYVLGYKGSQSHSDQSIKTTVSSLRLDSANKAGTASEILRDVLGVPVTLPEWAENDLRTIADQFQIENLNSENIVLLRQQLVAAGLGEYYPEALRQIAGTP